ALDQQKRFLASTCVGSGLRVLLLLILIPIFGFVGPAIAFVCSETLIVAIWMIQLARLGFDARPLDILWRPLVAAVAMALVLVLGRSMPIPWQIGTAIILSAYSCPYCETSSYFLTFLFSLTECSWCVF